MTVLPIKIICLNNESFHIMVEIMFNKKHIGNLVVDTGASKTIIDQNFAQQFVYDIEDLDTEDSSGINGQIQGAKTGTIAQINFGDMQITDYKCLMLDLSHINSIYEKMGKPKIAGLIGSDFLIKHGAIINYKKQTLTIYKTKNKIKC